ncbi:pleckstrin homology domain-containing family G member 6 [Tachyglossus aculeatus]|uniref:pleckstrin homology domain-containing family G member 6 n=1 Tax=Tachyglossus aculeatus TaxID=9261 RepID=UPI0018F29F0F|nr:pleckstrin homology domain-containing family G member 6 [Tachyglossus aculeatus]
MQTFGPPNQGPLVPGLVASRIETYGGRRAPQPGAEGSLQPRGDVLQDPGRRRLQDLVLFNKGPGQSRGLSPLRLKEPEHDRKHGHLYGPGPPHSPKIKEVTRVEQLQARLHTFSMFGIPRLPPEDRRRWEIGEGRDGGLAESSWKELVAGHETMSRELCHQQEAMWELISTECIYVRKLKVMTDLLAAGLLNLQRVGLLMEVPAETLFGNVPDLIRVHRRFWEEVLGPILEETRESGQPLDPLSLQDGFLTFGERFSPYVQYCLHVKRTMEFARHQQEHNYLFQTFVKWCEKHKRSGRQQLGDLLIKPQQRVTKYPLLLRAVFKRSPDPRQREALGAMISAVESFLHHINAQVRRGEDQENLAAAAQRIGPYDVLEPSSEEVEKKLRPFSVLDLTTPMPGTTPHCTRQLLMEGAVRMKEGREGKLDVYLFLFSDALLVTKRQRKAERAKVIRPPLMLEKLVCQSLRDPNSFLLIHLSEFQCVSSALIMHCPTSSVSQQWLERIQEAQVTLQKMKAEEYVQQKRELLALYRDTECPSPSLLTSPDASQSSIEEPSPEPRTAGSSPTVPLLLVTDLTEEPPTPDDGSDAGYGTLVPRSPRSPPPSLAMSHRRRAALRRDPRLTFSTMDLRDVPRRPRSARAHDPQRRSAPDLPDGVLGEGRMAWSDDDDEGEDQEEEEEEEEDEDVVLQTLHRARLRRQFTGSSVPSPADSASGSPWASEEEKEEQEREEEEEERGGGGRRPGRSPSPRPLRAEDMLREIREELAGQRIEGQAEPAKGSPRKLTRAQLQRMRRSQIIQLDNTLTVS